MTSKIKVDNINKVSDDSNIIKKCGTTTTIGSGASNPIVVDGSAVTIGRCGGTVALASGATQSGFGRSGSVNWQTTPKTSTFTAVSGEGYFINSGSALTCNLPAGTAGDIVAVSDYARNFATYNFSVSPNGSEKIGGIAGASVLNVNGQSATFVYVDATKGWVNVQNAEDTEVGTPPYICATGGTISYCGNFKIHKFTGPGTFTVNSIATQSPAPEHNTVSYMVVAGGGGGGANCSGGGGGAGGFREVKNAPICSYTASPLDGYGTPANRITVAATPYPITVGGGGPTPKPSPYTGPSSNGGRGASGSNSIFSTITSAGGGGGGGGTDVNGVAGGSGGGGAHSSGSGASGNTPPVSPAQGKDGMAPAPGVGPAPSDSGGGGGGATACAENGPVGRAGGAGATTEITASPVAYSGGGGGTNRCGGDASDTAGGTGGGGRGGFGPRVSPAPESRGVNGSDNTGGGGGGGKPECLGPGPSRTYGGAGLGGSGIVVIRYRYQ